jgi:hypothetical protein
MNPFDFEGVYREFADLGLTADGALEFVRKYGFLVRPPSERQEPVDGIVHRAEEMARLLTLYEKRNWSALAAELNIAAHISTMHAVGDLGIVFQWTHGDKTTLPQVKLRPSNLFSALKVQLLLGLSAGVELRRCRLPTCTKWFTTSEKGHRSTRVYCGREHMQRHNYELKKERLKKREKRK